MTSQAGPRRGVSVDFWKNALRLDSGIAGSAGICGGAPTR